jgi:hypothetical protein
MVCVMHEFHEGGSIKDDNLVFEDIIFLWNLVVGEVGTCRMQRCHLFDTPRASRVVCHKCHDEQQYQWHPPRHDIDQY